MAILCIFHVFVTLTVKTQVFRVARDTLEHPQAAPPIPRASAPWASLPPSLLLTATLWLARRCPSIISLLITVHVHTLDSEPEQIWYRVGPPQIFLNDFIHSILSGFSTSMKL